MAHAAQHQSLSFGAAAWLLLRETYAPGLHVAFAAGWFCALDGALAVASGVPWRPDARTLAGTSILFVTLFYLRAADEWKDVEYDRAFNPARPLARGAVTSRQVLQVMAASACLAMAIHFSAFAPALSAAVLVLDFLYGIALVYLERASETLRDNIWLNLAVTYPVNVLLSVYTLFLHSERHSVPISASGIWIVVAFALAFLHYEFSRKIAWPEHTTPGRRLYSTSLGTPAAAAMAIGFAAAAITLTAWFGIWLPALGLISAGVGLIRLINRKHKPSAPLAGSAMQFLVLYYVGIVASALWISLW